MSNQDEATTVVCPSGLTGEVRPISVKDLALLNRRQKDGKKMKKVRDPMGRFLSSLWVETTSPGIYGEAGIAGYDIGKPLGNMGNVLLGDRAFLTYQSREITHGPDLYWTFRCPVRTCREKLEEHIDLEKLEVSGLSDEARKAVIEAGLEAVLYRTLPVTGHKVGFRLMKGSDQNQLREAAKTGEEEFAITGLLLRVPFIELKTGERLTGPGERRKFLGNLHVSDAEYLKEQWEEADIYVQDSVETECLECGWSGEIDIPTDARFFSKKSAVPALK